MIMVRGGSEIEIEIEIEIKIAIKIRSDQIRSDCNMTYAPGTDERNSPQISRPMAKRQDYSFTSQASTTH